MRLGFFARQVHSKTEVRGVTSSGKHTSSFRCLVERGLVDTFKVLVGLEHRLEPHHGAASVENLLLGFTESSSLVIPAAAFNEHAEHVDTFFGLGQGFVVNDIMDDFEVQVHRINGNLVLTGVVLQGTGQETVSEEELVDPEVLGDRAVGPGLEEVKSFLQVLDVACKGLQARIRLAHPKSRHFTIKH